MLGLLAALGSGFLLGGALFFQYGLGLAPCEMCHWQRWPHIVAIVAGLGAFAASSNRKLALGLLLVAIGSIVVTSALGVFHAGVEYRWWAGPQACAGTIPTGLSPEELKKYLFGAKMVSLRRARLEAGRHLDGGVERHPVRRVGHRPRFGCIQTGKVLDMKTGDIRNPGDPDARDLVERTIRVDQAGEFGAVRIYEGQLAALRWTGRANSEAGRKIAHMARQEREHNKVFDRLLVERRVRPTALSPLLECSRASL